MNRVTVCISAMFTMASAPGFAAMTLSSADIAADKAIPRAHIYPRCGGRNISPQLSWSGAPAATQSFVLTMIDVDVKPSQWSHWIVVGLPASVHTLAQGSASLPGSAAAVVSNFGDATYDGPCPPKGSGLHHYQFTIWALPTAAISLAADQKATDVTALLSQRALDRASFTAWVQAP
jgi:Raf kinase inhibitor-like YbhB/YbcL family protein